MTVAEMIKKTRTDENMTQEEYGDRFGVTRKTVSSWENGRSVPDLQLLINICDSYNLSLDMLLREDTGYVRKTDNRVRLGRTIKWILMALLAAVCVFLVLAGMWKLRAVRLNEEFADAAAKLGFTLSDGYYRLTDADTVYSLPNQKLPFMRLDFYVAQINAEYRSDEFECDIVMTEEAEEYRFTVHYGLDGYIEGRIASDGTAEYDECSDSDREVISEHGEEIEEMLGKMTEYWMEVYTAGITFHTDVKLAMNIPYADDRTGIHI